jgi:uncharacterized protein (TIGR02722 family)
MIHQILKVGVVCVSLILVLGCGGKTVTRVETNTTIDLSGKWNDADSRMVAEEMINDCLSKPWYGRYEGANAAPRVIVGRIRNSSHEHINTETFIKDIERTLINSGKVEFVASKDEREQIREERDDQMADNASEETMKVDGQEVGADLMLYGGINTIADSEGNETIMYYQVDLELAEIQSHRKLWIGTKKIKKYITQGKAKL